MTPVMNAFVPILAASDMVMYMLPAAGCMLLFYGIYQVVAETRVSSHKKVQDRLRGERTQREKVSSSILRREAMAQTSASIADALVGKLSIIPRFQTLLNQADLRWSAPRTLFNLVSIAVVGALGLFVLQFSPFAALGCGGGTIILPLLWMSMRRKRRMNKLNSQLPDVFEMMSQALRAGHSLAGATQLIYEQMPPPVATEFGQVYHEQNLGVKIEEALQAMADRVDSLDVRFFVTAVMIQRQTGGDLAEVLDNISGVIRERIELAGLVRGLTAEGRLSGWVLFALPAVVFFASMYLNPAYARVLLEEPSGQMMLMLAGGMQLMGIAMIRWIVNIKV
jgi:tight adherence protein B